MFLRSAIRAAPSLSFPAVFAHSEPARSTRWSFPHASIVPASVPSSLVIARFVATVSVNTQCERDECLFIFVSPTFRRSCARWISPSTSDGLATACSDSPLDDDRALDLGLLAEHRRPLPLLLEQREAGAAALRLAVAKAAGGGAGERLVGREQIGEVLIVDLEVRRRHRRLEVLVVLEVVEDCVDGARDDPLLRLRREVALHRVRLPRPRLPVREHRRLVPLHHVADHRPHVGEHVRLVGLRGEGLRLGAAARERWRNSAPRAAQFAFFAGGCRRWHAWRRARAWSKLNVCRDWRSLSP